MHIRQRNQIAQLIRTTYDPATKKGKNTILGKVKLSRPELDDALRSELTDEELGQFEIWKRSQAQIAQLRSQMAALTLAEAMGEASRWLAANADSEDARVAATLIQGELPHLRKALKQFALQD
jgi:hypothetical protein